MQLASRRIPTAVLLVAVAAVAVPGQTPAAGPADLVITIGDGRGALERSGAELARVRNLEDDGLATGAAAARSERAALRRRRGAIIRSRRGHVLRATSTPAVAAKPVTRATNPGASADGLPRLALTRLPRVGVQVAAERVPDELVASGGPAAEIDAYLAEQSSPLAGLGATFVAEGRRWGVDPRLLVAISGAETSFATYGPSQVIRNPFGLGPGRDYPTWGHSISAAASNLAGPIYRGAGRVTIPMIQIRWAPAGAKNDPTGLNSNWTRNVSRYYAELGGDPSGSVFTDTSLPIDILPAIGAGSTVVTAVGPAVTVPGGGAGAGPWAAQDALALLGSPYRYGGASPTEGFDAAGLIRFTYGRRGVTLPVNLAAQARLGSPVAPGALRPGDAVFFAQPDGRIHHAGLYVGGGQFVHAAPNGGVRRSSLSEPAITRAYAGARRY